MRLAQSQKMVLLDILDDPTWRVLYWLEAVALKVEALDCRI